MEQTRQDRTGVVTVAPDVVTAVNAALDTSGYHGPRITTGNYPTGYDTTNVFGRLDHQATAASNLQARYLFYHVTSDNARNVGGLSDVSRGAALDDTDQTGAINYLTTLSSGLINEARAQIRTVGLVRRSTTRSDRRSRSPASPTLLSPRPRRLRVWPTCFRRWIR